MDVGRTMPELPETSRDEDDGGCGCDRTANLTRSCRMGFCFCGTFPYRAPQRPRILDPSQLGWGTQIDFVETRNQTRIQVAAYILHDQIVFDRGNGVGELRRAYQPVVHTTTFGVIHFVEQVANDVLLQVGRNIGHGLWFRVHEYLRSALRLP